VSRNNRASPCRLHTKQNLQHLDRFNDRSILRPYHDSTNIVSGDRDAGRIISFEIDTRRPDCVAEQMWETKLIC
jgi:hypothetical protein